MTKTEANETVDWDDPSSPSDSAAGPDLCFVIVFHPQTWRIGELATWAWGDPGGEADSGGELEFGRHAPVFSMVGSMVSDQEAGRLTSDRPDNDRSASGVSTADPASTVETAGLEDPCISREAFSMRRVAGGWCLTRRRGRSRMQVSGNELADDVTFTDAQLESGIVLTLARRVVLHCRLRRGLPMSLPLDPPLDQLLGISPAMQELKREIVRIAAAPDDVLLLGATGTGKERVAQAIHALSGRARGPWVAVNMAAIPVELAAASLFGARRGAYTGADSNRRGYFQQAAGGTLFLDEIGDTPELVQPLLLRALQERELQVVGGASEAVDLRVVSATERDPAAGDVHFRASLRQRLAAQEIRLPALCERAEDIGLLAAAQFRALAERDGTAWDLTAATDLELQRWARCFEMLVAYRWPGNVRELLHAAAQIHHASGSALVLPGSLAQRLRGADPIPSAPVSGQPVDRPLRGDDSQTETETETDTGSRRGTTATEIGIGASDLPGRVQDAPRKRLADLSDSEFLQAWRLASYEVTSLARALGVSRAAVYRRLSITKGCRLARDVPLGELTMVLEECRGDLRRSAQRLAVSARGLEARLRSSGMRPTRDGFSSDYPLSG